MRHPAVLRKMTIMEEKTLLPSPTALRPPPRLRSLHRRFLRFLVPSFLSKSDIHTRDVVRPTDFLDGMRGYAAFIVFFCHFIMPAHPKAHTAYGGGYGGNDRWLTQLPLIRLFYSGQACVFLFFVISGFSISLKPLTLARRGAYPQLYDALASATFRRAGRMYLPSIAALVGTLVMACFGAFRNVWEMTKDWPFPGKPLEIPMAFDTTTGQIGDFMRYLWRWCDPLTAGTYPADMPYASQLWTIPVELRCSLITFVTILGLAKVTSKIRIWTMAMMAVYFHLRRHPEAPLFLAGTILAELHLIRREKDPEAPKETRSQKIRNAAIFIFGLVITSYPRHGARRAFVFSWIFPLAKFVVSDNGKLPLYFVTSIGSTLLIYIVSISPSLQSIFITPLARYLGKISFALYCVHMAFINWFGYRSMLFWWSITGTTSVLRYELGLGIGFVIQTIITIWVADVFWRAVDIPSVQLAKYLEERCTSSRF